MFFILSEEANSFDKKRYVSGKTELNGGFLLKELRGINTVILFSMDQDTDILGVGVSASVPNCPRGRLMYYLDCVNSLLDLGDQYDTAKLRYVLTNK